MQNDQQNEEVDEKEKIRIANVFAAMMEELGVGRKDDLPLQDRGPNVSSAPVRQAPPRRPLSSGVLAWNNVVFDDVDPSQDQLDSMGDGQLHRMRKQAQGHTRGDLQGSRGGRADGQGRGGFSNVGNRGYNGPGQTQIQTQNFPISSSMHTPMQASGRAAMSPPRGPRRAFAASSSRMDTTVARLRAKSNGVAPTLADNRPRPTANGHNGNVNDDNPEVSSKPRATAILRAGRQTKPARLVEGPSWVLESASTFSFSPMPAQTPSVVQAQVALAAPVTQVAPIHSAPPGPSLRLPAQPHALQLALLAPPTQYSKKEELPTSGSASQTIQLPIGGGLGASKWAEDVPAPTATYQSQRGRFNSEWAHPSRSAQSGRAVPATSTPTPQLSMKIEAIFDQSSEEEEAFAADEAPEVKREVVRTFNAEVRIGNGPVILAIIRLTRMSQQHPVVLEVDAVPNMQRIFTDSVPLDAGLQLHGPSVIFRHNGPAGQGNSYWTIVFRLVQYAEALYGLITTDTFRPATDRRDAPKKQVVSNMDTAQWARDVERAVEDGGVSAYPSRVSDPPSMAEKGQIQSIDDLQAVEDGILIDFASREESASQNTTQFAAYDLKKLNDDLVVGHVLQQMDARYSGSFLNSLFAVVENSRKKAGMEITLGIDAPIDAILLSDEHLTAARDLVNGHFLDPEDYVMLEEELGEEYLSDMSWQALAKALLIRDAGLAKPEDSEADQTQADPIVQDDGSSPPDAGQGSTPYGSSLQIEEASPPDEGRFEEQPTTCADMKEVNTSSQVIYEADNLLRMRPKAIKIARELLSPLDMMTPVQKNRKTGATGVARQRKPTTTARSLKTPQLSAVTYAGGRNVSSNSGSASKSTENVQEARDGQGAIKWESNDPYQQPSAAAASSYASSSTSTASNTQASTSFRVCEPNVKIKQDDDKPSAMKQETHDEGSSVSKALVEASSTTAETPALSVLEPTASVQVLVGYSTGAVASKKSGDPISQKNFANPGVATSDGVDKSEPTEMINASKTEQTTKNPQLNRGKYTPSNSKIVKLANTLEGLNFSKWGPEKKAEPMESSAKATSSGISVGLPRGYRTLQGVKVEPSPSDSGGFHDIPMDFSGSPGLAASRWATPEAKGRTESKPSYKALPRSNEYPSAHLPEMAPLIMNNSYASSSSASAIHQNLPLVSRSNAPTAATFIPMREVTVYAPHEATCKMKEVTAYVPDESQSMTKQENLLLPAYKPGLDMYHRNLSESSDVGASSQQGIKEPRHTRGHQDASGMCQSRPALSPVHGNNSIQAQLQSRLDLSMDRH